jgi:hypothetical protein
VIAADIAPANQRVIVDSFNAKRALKPTLDPDRATDILWTFNHPSQWQQLVIQRGWTPRGVRAVVRRHRVPPAPHAP